MLNRSNARALPAMAVLLSVLVAGCAREAAAPTVQNVVGAVSQTQYETYQLAIENMGRFKRQRSFRSDFEELAAFVDEIGSDKVGICLDTSHAVDSDIDIPAGIRACGRRLVATHISDSLGPGHDHQLPYCGRIDWEPVVAALRDVQYDNPFNLEIPRENRCPMPVRRLKARYVRDLLGLMLEP